MSPDDSTGLDLSDNKGHNRASLRLAPNGVLALVLWKAQGKPQAVLGGKEERPTSQDGV